MKKLILCAVLTATIFPHSVSSQCSTLSTPSGNCASFGDNIDAFSLNTIAAVGIAGCSPNAYDFFNSPIWNLTIGNTYPFTAAVGGGTWAEGFAMWIDLNNDGFYTSNEMMYSASAASITHGGNIAIPFSATVANNIRMRLRCGYGYVIQSSEACTTPLNGTGEGETQDFLVNITCPVGNPTVNITASNTFVCSGQQTTLTATGAASYTWSGGITNGSGFTPTITTTYTVTGGVSGCPNATTSAFQTISVTSVPAQVSANVSPTVICASSSATLTGVGTTNYTWMPGNMFSSSVAVGPSATTIYTLIGYSGSGCPGTTTVSLAVNPLPSLTINASSTLVCEGSSVNISVSGAQGYTWQPGGSNLSSVVFNPTVSTLYLATGINSFGCTTSISKVILVDQAPNVSASATPSLICSGDNSVLTFTGNATTYSWSTGAQTNSVTVNPLNTTAYMVVGTNTSLCTKTVTVTVSVYTPTFTVSPATSTSICQGSTITLVASNADGFLWVNEGSIFNSINVTPSVSTTYTVIASKTESNITCTASQMIQVTVLPLPAVVAAPDRSVVCRLENVKLTSSGANSYLWKSLTGTLSASATFTQTMSSNGTFAYTVIGTNTDGCENSVNIQVKVNACTGIENEGTVADLVKIYPNPNNGFFTIEANKAVRNLQLTDVSGRLIRNLPPSISPTQINLGDLAAGIYYVKVQTDLSTTVRKLVIE